MNTEKRLIFFGLKFVFGFTACQHKLEITATMMYSHSLATIIEPTI
jgi:hypothetical protein